MALVEASHGGLGKSVLESALSTLTGFADPMVGELQAALSTVATPSRHPSSDDNVGRAAQLAQ
jgi:hypothetical protein